MRTLPRNSAGHKLFLETIENNKKHSACGLVLSSVLSCLKLRWNTKHEFLNLLLQQKKISLNFHFNRFSQFNYYIWYVKYAWTSKKCVWCAWSYHLIAALTIVEYSTTEVTLPSCLSVASEQVASQSKWQSADLDHLKVAKRRKSVWPALFRGNVCI